VTLREIFNVARERLTRLSIFGWRVPGRLLLLAGGLLLVGVWFHAHDASVRQADRQEQRLQQAAAEVAGLQAQAAAAVREALARQAAAVEALDARRRKLEQEATRLRARLAALQTEERLQVERVAALPTPEVATRVAARLGLETRNSGFGVRDSGEPNSSSMSVAPGANASVPNSEPRIPSPALLLTDQGLRKAETAFLELDACREQAAVKDAQLANCHEAGAANHTALGQMNQSVAELKEAVRLKDEILARREAAHQVELKAARGSRGRRFLRALEYVALGVAVGAVVR